MDSYTKRFGCFFCECLLEAGVGSEIFVANLFRQARMHLVDRVLLNCCLSFALTLLRVMDASLSF